MALHKAPQPLFEQGLSARIRALIAAGLALALVQADLSLQMGAPVRAAISTLLAPAAELTRLPRSAGQESALWIAQRSELIQEIEQLNRLETLNALSLLEVERLREDNNNLRGLLALQRQLPQATVAAEVRDTVLDPLARRAQLSVGSNNGVAVGNPVVSSGGVLGQISRVGPLSSEVRLIIDTDFSVPVRILGSDIQAITLGSGREDLFELRYVNIEANVQPGDVVVTSGLDGIYPPGLPVGQVSQVQASSAGRPPRVVARPSASVAVQREVLVLLSKPKGGN